MAKPFYSLEETTQKLNRSEEDVRALVRDGELREFRDAGKIFFKAEDVDRLAGNDQQPETIGDSHDSLPTLADTGGGTSIIGLEPVEEADQRDETVTQPTGIGVFDDDELEIDADPMAKTQISASPVSDQVQLDSGPSGTGSGLLDLTREADDTSLGAELLDDIYSGDEDAEASAAPAEALAAASAAAAEPPDEDVDEVEEIQDHEDESLEAGETIAPRRIKPANDPSEGVFGGLLVGALLLVAFAGSVAAGVLQGFYPAYAAFLSSNWLIYLLPGALGVVVLALVIGLVLGRAATK